MAERAKRRKENVKSNFYVDSTCIDCGTCYWVANKTFGRDGPMSAVHQSPESLEDTLSAYRALYSCPTNSIGVYEREKEAKLALKSFPYKLEDNVFHCGFHSERSYGATSYFIQSERGNILIDSPRYTQFLANKFRERGGLRWQLLTHKDDIADTDRYHRDFLSQRMIHREDAKSSTKHFEVFFEGEHERQLDEDWWVIPVPGHTRGSVCFLYKEKFLFTGDHLSFSPRLKHLIAFKDACWHDFDIQIQSMERLLDFKFEFVLPGHGDPYRATMGEMKRSLQKCLEWMKS